MSTNRIVCVNTEHPHHHIIKVGTGTTATHYSRTWTVEQVRTAIRNGDRFFTISPSTNKTADVRADDCRMPGCTVKTIRSTADAIADNNLDNMVGCA